VWLAWFGVLLGAWLAMTGTTAALELVAGACAAAIGATRQAVARATMQDRHALDPRWPARFRGAPVRIVADMGVLCRALARALVRPRRPGGAYREVRLAEIAGTGEAPAGRRATRELRGSVAPNTIVVRTDAERGVALVHHLDVPAGRRAGVP
jgi:multisubunit Na+/H+ antiporter MnhE subunit